MLDAAAWLPVRNRWPRAAQKAWAVTSHARALASAPGDDVVPVAALLRDAYPRALTPARARAACPWCALGAVPLARIAA